MHNNEIKCHLFKKEMATCPFNQAHTFQKQKLVFHLQRCKDKEKRLPFMAKCKYNPFHYVDKQKIKLHEEICQDRKIQEATLNQYKSNFRNSLRQNPQTPRDADYTRDHRQNSHRGSERSRSREKKIEQVRSQNLKQEKIKIVQDHLHQSDEQTLSDCEECQKILKKFGQKIMQNSKIVKLIKKYEETAGYTIL